MNSLLPAKNSEDMYNQIMQIANIYVLCQF